MTDEEKQIAASHEIEKLATQLKEAVSVLRNPATGPKMAYAVVYEARTRLGYVVAKLGMGCPTGSALAYARQLLNEAVGE